MSNRRNRKPSQRQQPPTSPPFQDSTSSSLQDALAALREAQNGIDALRKAKEAAAAEVKQASEAVQHAREMEGSDEKGKTYGEQSYWENRYVQQQVADTSSSKTIEARQDLYEWYLPYPAIRALLMPELARYGGVGAKVLFPGCGNSSLCEDMASDGCSNLVGMDYSPSVISAMQARCALSREATQRIRYFCGDARQMSSEADGSYDLVVDKGTLDAIVSDTSEAGSGVASAIAYMQELWRVLCKKTDKPTSDNGRALFLTTMTPPVLSQLFDAASSISSDKRQRQLWILEEANMVALKTSEGRDIYFYSFPCNPLYKRAPIIPAPIPNSSHSKNIAEEIEKIRKETEDAMKALQLAQQSLEQSRQRKSETESSLGDTEQRVRQLQQTIDQSWANVSAGIESETGISQVEGSIDAETVSATLSQPMKAAEKSATAPLSAKDGTTCALPAGTLGRSVPFNWREEELVERTVPLPRLVTLQVDLDGGGGVCSRHASVRYRLHRDPTLSIAPVSSAAAPNALPALFEVWDEDDMIVLECVCFPEEAGSGREVFSTYAADDPQPHESFEYTVNPISSDSLGVAAEAELSYPLPAYGSWFCFSYIRQVTRVIENGAIGEAATVAEQTAQSKYTVVRERLRLARSKSFHLSCAIFPCRPDTCLPGGGSVRRRGGGVMKSISGVSLREWDTDHISNHLSASNNTIYRAPLITLHGNKCLGEDAQHGDEEDLKGAARISLCVGSTAAFKHVCLTRVMAWAFPSSAVASDVNGNRDITIVVEADVVEILRHGKGYEYSGKLTKYWILPLRGAIWDPISLPQSYGVVKKSQDSISLHLCLNSSSLGYSSKADSLSPPPPPDATSLACGFCGAELVSDLVPHDIDATVLLDASTPRPLFLPLAQVFDHFRTQPVRFVTRHIASKGGNNSASGGDIICAIYGHNDAIALRTVSDMDLPVGITVGEHTGRLTLDEKKCAYKSISCGRCWNILGDITVPADPHGNVPQASSRLAQTLYFSGHSVRIGVGDIDRCTDITHMLCRALQLVSGSEIAEGKSRRWVVCIGDPIETDGVEVEVVDAAFGIALTDDDVDYLLGRNAVMEGDMSVDGSSRVRCGIMLRYRDVSLPNESESKRCRSDSAPTIFVPYAEFMQLRAVLKRAAGLLTTAHLEIRQSESAPPPTPLPVTGAEVEDPAGTLGAGGNVTSLSFLLTNTSTHTLPCVV